LPSETDFTLVSDSFSDCLGSQKRIVEFFGPSRTYFVSAFQAVHRSLRSDKIQLINCVYFLEKIKFYVCACIFLI